MGKFLNTYSCLVLLWFRSDLSSTDLYAHESAVERGLTVDLLFESRIWKNKVTVSMA